MNFSVVPQVPMSRSASCSHAGGMAARRASSWAKPTSLGERSAP